MVADTTYAAARGARLLHRCGEWDAALALLPDDCEVLRAKILVDRFFWRQDGHAAQAAVDGLDPATTEARQLSAQLAYARLLFDLDPRPDDRRTAEAGFEAAADDAEYSGWGTFLLGVYADNILGDRALAEARYDKALALSTADAFLESYVVRHLGDHAMASDPAEGERLLRRSLHLRAALGARPQVAAAQVSLAGVLPEGAERTLLREAALIVATDLRIPWLLRELAPGGPADVSSPS